MTNISVLVFVIFLISNWNILLAKEESTKKINGRIVYKYIDDGGMEWEYEHIKEKMPDKAKSEDVVVFNGPWTTNARSSAQSCMGSNQLLSVLVRCIQFN